MIHNELWTGIGMKQGLLCDRCFRKRLDRPLRAADTHQVLVMMGSLSWLRLVKCCMRTNGRQHKQKERAQVSRRRATGS